METKKKTGEKFSQSLTFKGITIVILILLLLIPNAMIMDLIHEREERSNETIQKINEKWSLPQTVCGPILTIPFTTTFTDTDKKTHIQGHELHITPKELNIHTRLFPEERHYGIYKSILYKSEISISGQFAPLDYLKTIDGVFDLGKAHLGIELSDLRGVTKQLEFNIKGHSYPTEVGGNTYQFRKNLEATLGSIIKPDSTESYSFECQLSLNGSSNLRFIPAGSTTNVTIEGDWKAPGFTGSFTPDYQPTEKGFQASWSILNFNRNIPEYWIDDSIDSFEYTSFGVILVEPVDHYQQNMRSSKYSLLFIALTFAVFFFVEILTQKRIHPIQYLLVGLALILFYSLLLSISEQINFAIAYLIAAVATIALITAYTHSIFKNKSQTGILLVILAILYLFLYVILQLEDVALLIGSIGLFIILGIIMFISRKIKWYKPEHETVVVEEEKPK
ncbi:MAG: cell envelope integrity protein CreD [Candidatus Symbiothrix sp.]|jgi:inner membrane protein|nr:cell envelope integrity protein CreD [Candidatus Symbiothrix sp.]